MNKGSRILISVAVGLIALIVLVLVGFRLVMRIPVAS